MTSDRGKGIRILHGEDVDADYLKKIHRVDMACYEEKYRDTLDNIIKRYEKNPRTFIFAEEEETGELAGYLNVFPCEEGLYQDNLWRAQVIRDDDVTPEEVAEYRTDGNYLYIHSFAIHPDHQGTDVVRLMSNDFIACLNQLEKEGFPVTDILATAVSPHGKKALANYKFRPVRMLADGNMVFICDGQQLSELLAGFRSDSC